MSDRSECPYCLTRIGEADEVTSCEACGAAYHSECWIENGGCCVRDCANVRRIIDVDVAAEPPEKLVISRESAESARPHRAAANRNPCIRCGREVPEGKLYCEQCTPEPEEHQDVRNLGPILIMLAIGAIVLAWLIIGSVEPGDQAPRPPPGAGSSQLR